MADACLQVPIWGDGARVECLQFKVIETPTECAFALKLDTKPVDVASGKGFALEPLGFAAFLKADFGQIEHDQ